MQAHQPKTTLTRGHHSTRFDWILDAAPCGPDLNCDHLLAENESFVATPTLGSIVPNWVLIVPKLRVLSFAVLEERWRSNLFPFLNQVEDRLVSSNMEIVSFEHGARKYNSLTGCGVDQAHLHVLALPRGFLPFILQRYSSRNWTSVDQIDPWSAIDSTKDYHLMKSGNSCFVSYSDCSVSQFFRRAVAEFMNRQEDWDYRLVPHYDNAQRTIESFRV
jgi:ATP adenylyltransferase